MPRLRYLCAIAFLSLILAACEQEPAKVSYRDATGDTRANAGAEIASTGTYSSGAFDADEPSPMRQPAPPGDKSGPVHGAFAGASAGMAPASNATLPVDYATRGYSNQGAGAGSQAASYYATNPMGAGAGGASHSAAPRSPLSAQTAGAGSAARAFAPIPLAAVPTAPPAYAGYNAAAAPFGKPSAPLPPAYAAADPYAMPGNGMGAPPLSEPLAPDMPNPYAGMMNAPSPSGGNGGMLPAGYGGDYAGVYAFDGATAMPPAPSTMAPSPMAPAPMARIPMTVGSMAAGSMAAPSLPAPVPDGGSFQQATAAPVDRGIQSAPVSGSENHFVIQTEKTAPEPDADTAPPATAAAGGFAWPVRGTVVSKFGPKGKGKSNDGINIAAPVGSPIQAAADGMVVYAGNELQGYGNMLVLSHEGNRATVYAHAQKLLAKKGDFVKQGQKIALVGQTGGVTAPQLHFALREGNRPVDPMPYLGKDRFAAVE